MIGRTTRPEEAHMTRMFSIVSLALLLALTLSVPEASAKTVQAGWDRRLPTANRFKVVYDGEAVLDQETGLVWDRHPGTFPSLWSVAIGTCLSSTVGNRRGWRLPRADELQSLMDTTQSTPPLPSGHPFVNVNTTDGQSYWSATDAAGSTVNVYSVGFAFNGQFFMPPKSGAAQYRWCVRGPGGGQLD
jgi:hypothetical protein